MMSTVLEREIETELEERERAAMAEEKETLMERIAEKLHSDSSSSSSDDEQKKSPPAAASSSSSAGLKEKVFRLFGREKPVHHVLGGGKPADVFLWRNKKVSAGILGSVTAVWVLFELLEYHLLTLVCHSLILTLAVLFVYSNATTFINKSPPHIPEVSIPEDLTVQVALGLRYEINRGFALLRCVATGRDRKKFLALIAGLYVLSVVGSCCNFLTLFYLAFVGLHTVPLLYEKYDEQVDSFAEKATAEFNKYYAVFRVKVLSKIPKAPLKDKKLQ